MTTQSSNLFSTVNEFFVMDTINLDNQIQIDEMTWKFIVKNYDHVTPVISLRKNFLNEVYELLTPDEVISMNNTMRQTLNGYHGDMYMDLVRGLFVSILRENITKPRFFEIMKQVLTSEEKSQLFQKIKNYTNLWGPSVFWPWTNRWSKKLS